MSASTATAQTRAFPRPDPRPAGIWQHSCADFRGFLLKWVWSGRMLRDISTAGSIGSGTDSYEAK
jgi:hypothetical protein